MEKVNINNINDIYEDPYTKQYTDHYLGYVDSILGLRDMSILEKLEHIVNKNELQLQLSRGKNIHLTVKSLKKIIETLGFCIEELSKTSSIYTAKKIKQLSTNRLKYQVELDEYLQYDDFIGEYRELFDYEKAKKLNIDDLKLHQKKCAKLYGIHNTKPYSVSIAKELKDLITMIEVIDRVIEKIKSRQQKEHTENAHKNSSEKSRDTHKNSSEKFKFNEFKFKNNETLDLNRPITLDIAYKIFGLNKSTISKDMLKKKYRLLASRYHPDRNIKNSEIMKRVNMARDLLNKELPK